MVVRAFKRGFFALFTIFSLSGLFSFQALKFLSLNYFAREFLNAFAFFSIVLAIAFFFASGIALAVSFFLSRNLRSVFAVAGDVFGQIFGKLSNSAGKPLLASSLFAGLLLATALTLSKAFDPEIFWKIGLFFREPLGCFAKNLGGNYAIGGSFFPSYAGLFSVVFGNSAFSLALSGGILSTVAIFLIYLCAREIYGKGPALFLATGSLFLANYFPLVEISNQETGMQAVLSLIALFLILSRKTPGEALSSPLFWLVSGIGFLNKLFFLTFLLAVALSLLVFGKSALPRPGMKGRLIRLALFLLGAFPFVYYNVFMGFPSGSAFAAVGKNALDWGFLSNAIGIRAEQVVNALVPFRGTFEAQELALFSLAIILPFIFGRGKVNLKKHAFIILVSFLFVSLSTISYSSYFNPRQLSAITPVFLVLLAGPAALVPEKFGWILPAALFLLLLVDYNDISSQLILLRTNPYPLPEIDPGPGRMVVTSCVEGGIAPYLLPEKEAVFSGNFSDEPCPPDAVIVITRQKEYFGSVKTPYEERARSFISKCASEGRPPYNYSHPNIGEFYFWDSSLLPRTLGKNES